MARPRTRGINRTVVAIEPADRQFWSSTPGEWLVLECGHRVPRMPPSNIPPPVKRNTGDRVVCRECRGLSLWWT